MTNPTVTQQIREIVELFRKQCVNKEGGIGFEETTAQLSELMRQERIDELKRLDAAHDVGAKKGKDYELLAWNGGIYIDKRINELKGGE